MFKKILIAASLLSFSSITYAQYQCDQMIQKTDFEICYNYKLKSPLWAKTTLHKSDLLEKGNSRKNEKFYEEQSIPKKHRSTLADYRGSGYDRGHLIAAEDVNHSARALKDSFSLANISMQTPEANRGIYRHTETLTRKLITRYATKGTVISGSIFDEINPKRIGPGLVAIPTYLFRIVLLDNGKSYSFLLPNTKDDMGNKPSKYEVPIEKIEKLTGFDFSGVIRRN